MRSAIEINDRGPAWFNHDRNTDRPQCEPSIDVISAWGEGQLNWTFIKTVDVVNHFAGVSLIRLNDVAAMMGSRPLSTKIIGGVDHQGIRRSRPKHQFAGRPDAAPQSWVAGARGATLTGPGLRKTRAPRLINRIIRYRINQD